MNEEQMTYTIEKIEKYREEENKSDRKAFWQLVFTNASIILIGISTYLSNDKLNIIPKDIALVSDVILGVIGTTLFSESIRNNSKSNVASSEAKKLEYSLELEKRIR
jgi:hypothetical protein